MTAATLPFEATFLAEPKDEVGVHAKDDNELAIMAQDGSMEAFQELVERFRKKAYWIARRMVGNHETAMDISQEAFIRVYKALDRFNPEYRFYTWLYQIVTNLSIDHLRKAGKRNNVSIEKVAEQKAPRRHSSPFRAVAVGELKEQVEQVLETLPPKYRSVIVLRDIEGMSSKEIAEIVDRTHSTVRWRLHKARKLFRAAWEKMFPEEEELPHEV